MTRRREVEDPKLTALRQARCLNPHPEAVTDEVFSSQEFFDARDAVQVKYEMVRRVRVDRVSVSAASEAFGYSRPSFYQAVAALDEQGLDGLTASKPGPRGGHKITAEVSAFAEEQLSADPALRPAGLVDTIAQRFGVRVHPRSIERALTRYRDQQSKSH